MLKVGTQLGPYQVLSPLGAGGMGEVYRARDQRLGREVAVKVLPDRLAGNAGALALFEREMRAVAGLSHPNIVVLHDCGTERDVAYAVMELLDGETLRSRLIKAALGWRPAAEIGVAVAEGLAAAHGKGIIHRDLKPENLFLTADGRVKILDFGLARRESPSSSETPTLCEEADPAHTETGTYAPLLTKPGTVLGTIGYMSPEQVRGETADARSDLFALGCVLYEMVSGKRAFARKTMTATQDAILHEEPSDLADIVKGVPPELVRVIRHCLEKNREARFHSAHDLAFALRTLLSAPVRAARPTKPRRAPSRQKGEAIDSLAVLPLVNASGDANLEYLSDGITESIIRTLSQLPDLRVMARSTVFRFKGRDVDACAVGRKLKVRAVLTGRLLQRGDRLIVLVELVNPSNGAQLWGEQYNRPQADLLAVEEEIAREIVERLRPRLSESQRQRLDKRPTSNPEAYQLYLRGRYFWNKRTAEGMKKSIDLFGQAIDLDPTYALAYAGLADTYLNLGGWGQLAPHDAYPRAKAAAAKALEIDDTLAEAHCAIAMAMKEYDWDFAGAERAYRRALDLNPSYAVAHLWFAECLSALSRHAEAIPEFKRALELDPLSLVFNATLGRHGYHFARQYNLAIEQCRKTIEMDPHFWVAHHFLGGVYACMGRLPEAVTAFSRARQLEANPEPLAGLGWTYGRLGQRDKAQEVLEELHDLAKTQYVSPINFALLHIGLGDTEEAFGWLQKALEHRSQWLSECKVDPFFDSLRSDPRFQALLREIGFPATAAADDQPVDSLAILPLVNAAGNPDMEFLSDGITESLILSLSRLPSLRVMARSTVFRFKGKEADPQDVGRQLGVRGILTGRLSQAGERLVIQVELVNPADGAHLWGAKYERPAADIFKLQEELATEIAAQLRLRLSGADQKRLAKRPTDNVEAYQLYLRGHFFWGQFTEDTTRKAIECFHQALALDPDYPLALAGLADCYTVLGTHYCPPREAFPEAKKALKRALELDDTLAEVHVALGWVLLLYDREWLTAERALRQALRLNPNHPMAQNAYGLFCAIMGRFEEGITHLRRAIELDPLGANACCDLAWVYRWKGDFESAAAELRQALTVEPNWAFAHIYAGLFAACDGAYASALAALDRAQSLAADDPNVIAVRGYVEARAGNPAKGRDALKQLQALATRRYVMPTLYASIHAALGENDEAFHWLRKAQEERSVALAYVHNDVTLKSLHADPRFAALLREIGFPGAATSEPREQSIDSLAILPLVNAAGDPDMEFLSDGITESLIYQLGRLPRLRVMSRNSAFRFKGKDLDVREAGRTLGVQAVLTGRVLVRGDALVISVELMTVQDDRHIWGERYNRKSADILAVETEIARDIVAKLRLKLGGDDLKRLDQRHTDKAEAHQLYLRGLYYWNKRTEEGLKKAIQCFEEALAIDPAYALAYAGLADCYNLPHFGALSTREAGTRATAAAVKALEIDENLAEAHVALAFARFQFDWDWAGAENGFNRAIELNPNNARAHHTYGSYLLVLGRFDEALAEIKRAEELDPLSLMISLYGGFVCHYARRYDQAIERYHKTLELDAGFAWAHYMLGLVYAEKGMYPEAVAAVERAWHLDESPVVLAGLGNTLARSGQREQALKVLDQLQELSKARPVAAYDIATVYAGLNDKEQAFAWLERAYEDRGLWLPQLRVDPMMDTLHSDPRFEALLKKMNFPLK